MNMQGRNAIDDAVMRDYAAKQMQAIADEMQALKAQIEDLTLNCDTTVYLAIVNVWARAEAASVVL